MSNPILRNSNANNLLQQFETFQKNLNGQNPKDIVMQLLNSGKMSKQQFENLKQQANMYMKLLNK